MITTIPHKIVSPSQPNLSHPLNRGLVGWWLAWPGYNGYGSNKWLDISGRGNHGTLTNMSPGTDWKHQYLDFDGSDDYVDVAERPELRLGSGGTIAAWVRTSDGSGSIASKITDSAGGDYNSWEFALAQGSNSVAVGKISFYNGAAWLSSGSTYHDGDWHHLAVVCNGVTTYLYADGVEDGSGSQALPATGTTVNVNFGTRGGTTSIRSAFDADIRDIRISDQLLSASEINTLYSEGLNGYPNLLAPITYPLPYSTAAPPPGTKIPIFAYHYAQMRS